VCCGLHIISYKSNGSNYHNYHNYHGILSNVIPVHALCHETGAADVGGGGGAAAAADDDNNNNNNNNNIMKLQLCQRLFHKTNC
jgi:hypothetical protein